MTGLATAPLDDPLVLEDVGLLLLSIGRETCCILGRHAVGISRLYACLSWIISLLRQRIYQSLQKAGALLRLHLVDGRLRRASLGGRVGESAAILEDLTRRFARPAVTTGGLDAVLQTYHRDGARRVIEFIVAQINRANGVPDANAETGE